MGKIKKKYKNQYYQLIEYFEKKKIAKVFNFKLNRVESYLTVLTKEEKNSQLKRQFGKQKTKKKIKKMVRVRRVTCKKDSIFLSYKFITHQVNLYNSYKRLFLLNNKLLKSILLSRYFMLLKSSRYESLPVSKFRRFIFRKNLEQFFKRYNIPNGSLNIISIHIILRRNNIYVTVVKDNKTVKVFSPCLFRHIPKRGKKKSISFFYTVKRTIMYITRFFFNKHKKYFLKIFFKGFQKLRRPLLSRFFF